MGNLVKKKFIWMGHPVKSGKQYLQVPPAHYINPGAKDCMEGG